MNAGGASQQLTFAPVAVVAAGSVVLCAGGEGRYADVFFTS
jgi:hypothetical protein